MRFVRYFTFLLFTVTTSLSYSQSTSIFQQQAQAISAEKPFHALSLSATAEWSAGSLHESGTAQLQASADGSSSVQLNLGKASWSETQGKTTGSLRSCAWADQSGISHKGNGPNCLLAVPWFAPTLLTQSSFSMPSLIRTTDDGQVLRDKSTVHEISYLLDLAGSDSKVSGSSSQSTVKVLYDPKTQLPTILEYVVHPDTDDSQNLDVKVLFSNYQSVAGVMLPFHIEKYLQRTLQLKLDITNASIE